MRTISEKVNKKSNFRSYNPSINVDLSTQYAVISNSILKDIVLESKSTIHTYLYLCTIVNRNADRGYIRNIKCKDISHELGMPLRTVQDAIANLSRKKFITRERNTINTFDFYIVGYESVFEKSYIKVPADKIFSKEFMNYNKDEMVACLYSYAAIYVDMVASMQQTSKKTHKENYELIYENNKSIRTDRKFSAKTILQKVKRVTKSDLNRVIEKIKEFGLNVAKEGSNYVFKIAKDTLKSLFKPVKESTILKNFPFSLRAVNEVLEGTGLVEVLGNDKHMKDLVLLHKDYGDMYFYIGVLGLQSRQMGDEFIDDNGEVIDNLCSYIRTVMDNYINNSISKMRKDAQ